MTKSVIVIDDSGPIISIVKSVLRENGFNALSASSGEAGIKLIRDNRPDLIVLDRHMEGLDGNEVLTRLKKDRYVAHIPVLMLTSENKMDEIRTSIALGAAGYMIKPFQPKDFISKINAVLSKNDSTGTCYVG
jgi:DNA-binding response OmpR family regulator